MKATNNNGANTMIIKLTFDNEIVSPIELSRRGLKLICHRKETDGMFVYSPTDKALDWVMGKFPCVYERESGKMVRIGSMLEGV